jgi:pyruvate/2-oxoglutarate/acetoin dehydrogenase E1 component
MMRELSYAQAIQEALSQAMELCPDVVLMGQLVNYRSGIFGTTTGLVEKFGERRVLDFPVAESLMTSHAVGAALTGVRPVLVHQRQDFMIYSLDAIVNWLALWRFKSGGKAAMPVVIRTIVGKGWGQGPQHSKSLHAWFSHMPGLRVAIPATAYDIKGLLLESILGENPVIFVENRSLFSMKDKVPAEPYRVRFGKGTVRRTGSDMTLVAIGSMVPLALRVAEKLATESIQLEVIDPRTISPLDTELIFQSLRKTKRLAVADPAWEFGSVSAEIIAQASSAMARDMRCNPIRITYPDSHTPASQKLEEKYYPNEEVFAQKIRAAVLE